MEATDALGVDAAADVLHADEASWAWVSEDRFMIVACRWRSRGGLVDWATPAHCDKPREKSRQMSP